LASALIDTNILVYSFDARESVKRRLAQGLLTELRPTGLAAITAQVLGEFFRVATTRLSPAIPTDRALGLVRDLAQSFPVWPLDERVVLEAARGVRDHRLHYYDAQVWAAARLNGASSVLSEDFQDGRTIEGVTFRDPFRRRFDIRRLLAGS
jgi:predicted nucleic acid-binding protein